MKRGNRLPAPKSLHRLEKLASSRLKEIKRRAQSSNEIDQAMLPMLQDRFLRSPYVAEAFFARQHRGTLDRALIAKQAAGFDPYAAFNRPIPFHEIPRTGRFPRLVCSLPRNMRVAHSMSAHLVCAQFEPHSALFPWPGRGKEDLTASLLNVLRSGRKPYLVMTDVIDCFPSINLDAIYGLKVLPDTLVAATLDTRRMSFRKKDRPRNGDVRSDGETPSVSATVHAGELVGLSGLLQGSPVSSPLLAMLLNDLPDRLPEGVQPYIFADNILVACVTRDAARRVGDALVCYFDSHAAGPLSPTTPEIIEPRSEFTFVGYTFEFIPGDGWRARPSNKNLVRAIQRVLQADERAHEVVIDEILSLMTAFPLTDEAALTSVVTFLNEA